MVTLLQDAYVHRDEKEEEEKEQRYGKTGRKKIRGEAGGEERKDVFRLPAI